jgi:hypothetical protein
MRSQRQAPDRQRPAPRTCRFCFTLDVRSFQASRRLPLNLASAYIQAFLPPEFLGARRGQQLHGSGGVHAGVWGRRGAASAIAACDRPLPGGRIQQELLHMLWRQLCHGTWGPVCFAAMCFVGAGFLSDCGARVPPKVTPLRSLPAVDISRGSEGALPNALCRWAGPEHSALGPAPGAVWAAGGLAAMSARPALAPNVGCSRLCQLHSMPCAKPCPQPALHC